MIQSESVVCPACWEEVEIDIDTDEGGQVFVYDCTVCCRPMTVHVRIGERGQIEDVAVSGDDG